MSSKFNKKKEKKNFIEGEFEETDLDKKDDGTYN